MTKTTPAPKNEEKPHPLDAAEIALRAAIYCWNNTEADGSTANTMERLAAWHRVKTAARDFTEAWSLGT